MALDTDQHKKSRKIVEDLELMSQGSELGSPTSCAAIGLGLAFWVERREQRT